LLVLSGVDDLDEFLDPKMPLADESKYYGEE
jgi:hypothetical protein